MENRTPRTFRTVCIYILRLSINFICTYILYILYLYLLRANFPCSSAPCWAHPSCPRVARNRGSAPRCRPAARPRCRSRCPPAARRRCPGCSCRGPCPAQPPSWPLARRPARPPAGGATDASQQALKLSSKGDRVTSRREMSHWTLNIA